MGYDVFQLPLDNQLVAIQEIIKVDRDSHTLIHTHTYTLQMPTEIVLHTLNIWAWNKTLMMYYATLMVAVNKLQFVIEWSAINYLTANDLT